MNQEKIGKFIAETRKMRKLTQAELAEKLGVTDRAVSNWENGRRIPDYSIITTLCDELGISVNDLFNGGIIDKEDMSKQTDNNIVNIMKYENIMRKKYKRKILLSVFITIIIVVISFLSIYFINNYNKIKIYKVYGDSGYFNYSGTFLKSNIKYFYFPEELILSNEAQKNNVKVTYIKLMSDFYTIYGHPGNPRTIEEIYGYGEYFSDEVVKNLDNWYVKITYLENNEEKEEIIKLKNELVMDNSSLIPKKNDSIYESLPTKEDVEITKERLKAECDGDLKYAKILESIGFEPLSKSVISDEQCIRPTYRKTLNNNSFYIFRIAAKVIDYTGENYLALYPIISNTIYFSNLVSDEDKDKWEYNYNTENDMGSCKKGECPNNFIREAREYYKKLKEEFKDLLNS